jgi:hypothetical protein
MTMFRQVAAILALGFALSAPAAADTVAQIEAMTRADHNARFHHSVGSSWAVVSGDYAIGDWHDENTAGVTVWHHDDRWHVLSQGGGMVGASDLVRMDVPSPTAKDLVAKANAAVAKAR